MYLGVREYAVWQANRRNSLALAPSTWAEGANEPIEFADGSADGDSGRLTDRTDNLGFDFRTTSASRVLSG